MNDIDHKSVRYSAGLALCDPNRSDLAAAYIIRDAEVQSLREYATKTDAEAKRLSRILDEVREYVMGYRRCGDAGRAIEAIAKTVSAAEDAGGGG